MFRVEHERWRILGWHSNFWILWLSELWAHSTELGNNNGFEGWRCWVQFWTCWDVVVLWGAGYQSLKLGGEVKAVNLKDWGQKKRASEDEMARWHQWCLGHKLGQTPGDGEGQGGLGCCGPWSHRESDTTGQLNDDNSQTLSFYRAVLPR